VPDAVAELADRVHGIAAGPERPVARVEADTDEGRVGRLQESAHLVHGLDERPEVLVDDGPQAGLVEDPTTTGPGPPTDAMSRAMRTASAVLRSCWLRSWSTGVVNEPTIASPRDASSSPRREGSVGMKPQSPSSVPT
jgi:hypothetical protein